MREGTAGWIDSPGSVTMNSYKSSDAARGDAAQAGPWVDQIKRNYPIHWEHIVRYFAHLVQGPGVKPNHAIVLGGAPGVGKDSIIAGVRYALGEHNVKSIGPEAIFGDFTPWTKCLLLIINEAHDTGDVTRAQFYERMKTVTAAPPDTLTFNDKHVKSYPVRNCLGCIITTNHRTGALYLPSDDRRYFVVWSDCVESDYSAERWAAYWAWFNAGGAGHVAAYLHSVDLSTFDPKARPERTPAWHAMVSASTSDGDLELADALDGLGRPAALTLDTLRAHVERVAAQSSLAEDFRNQAKNAARWPGRMSRAGYTEIRNVGAADGFYRIAGKRAKVFALRELPEGARQTAAEQLARRSEIPAPPSV
jgi:hypothetical protein